jgi:DNA mismatch repair protein MutS2
MLDSLELLEWPVLFEHLLNECLTPYGVQAWQAEPFLADVDAICLHQSEVEGLKTLLLRYGDVISESGLPDIGPAVKRLAKGGFLNLSDFQQIMRTLTQGGAMLRHFARALKSENALAFLEPLLNETVVPDAVLTHLAHYMEPDGELRDEASPKLTGLRQKLRHQRQALQQKIQSILHNPDYAQALQSPTVTERDGRSVFPVKVEHKGKLPGVIHGASSSGSTVFIEPQGLVDINNELQGVQADLQKEIERILKELSLYLHDYWEPLQAFIDALGRLDRRLAAARLSRLLDANPVEVCRAQLIDVRQAKHPLLVLNNRRKSPAMSVVANDIQIGTTDEGVRTLIITGPNTGGKTVLLKTIGLFACMLRAGLHLPVAEHSRMSLFDEVFVDIGDQQSIAQSLSTFSAHLQRLKAFVADETDLTHGLVMIDEIAAGTDPAEGAALAKAVLDELYRKGAITVVTTHLGELKLEAHQHPGFMNASVEFNAESLSPTYRLMLGVPGASNAITIAQRLGLKPSVIARARASMSAPVRESAELLQEFEARNRQLEEELQRARSYRLEAQEAYEKLEYERQQFEADKRQALKQFQISLKGRIHDLENQVKYIRKDLQREEPEDLDRLGHKLKQAGRKADRIFSETRDRIAEAPRLKLADLKPGDTVFSRQLEITGEVVSLLPATDAVVLQSGILRVTVPVSDLQKPYVSKKSGKQHPKNKVLDTFRASKVNEGASVLEDAQDPSLSCDVRGQRADEAVMAVEKFLDDAVMSGYHAVAVIHGMGTGALKKEIRNYLAGSAYVRRFYPAQATQGGDGKTIIELSG